jgi:signal transduction histidine kinase
MIRGSILDLDLRGLRIVLALFFAALAVPAAILIHHAQGQLRWSSFHQQQVLAEDIARRIDARFVELIAREESRSFGDYAFLVVEGDPTQSFVQRSPLSAYPVERGFPGLIGWFQVGADGAFSTPLVPTDADAASYGVSDEELARRLGLQTRIWQILSVNRLVRRNEPKAGEGAAPPRASRSIAREEARARAPGASGGAAADAARAKDEEERARDDRAAGAEAPSEVLSAVTSTPDAGASQAAAMSFSASSAEPQAAFDELAKGKAESARQQPLNALGRVEDLKLDASRYDAAPAPQVRRQAAEHDAVAEKRVARKETVAVPAAPAAAVPPLAAGAVADTLRVATFEGEIDPFELSLLDSGHFVLFRNVWREGQRYVQGVLVEPKALLDELGGATFRASALAETSDLVVADRGNVLAVYREPGAAGYASGAAELTGALLHRTRLSAPLNELELIFSVHRLPPGPGAGLLCTLAAILAIVLCGGFWLMYRLGAGQIALTRQQQDFVSAVSHELKTPLTSIRMYGEMLRAGWGSDAQKQQYYDYIYGESERLSRLINNVLQLARMNRNEQPLVLKPTTGGELVDAVRSKLSAQIERAGFALDLRCEPDAGATTVQVDPDAVLQIVINLVDNAIKFSARAEQKRIDVLCRRLHDHTLLLSVRDYGPGVAKDQTKKIFRLFYRSEDELTRETVGTGIGLALVHQLARAMRARIDVLNREPGAEFRVIFPV